MGLTCDIKSSDYLAMSQHARLGTMIEEQARQLAAKQLAPILDPVSNIKERVDESIHTELERRIEYALRFLIPMPIQGTVTRAKVRYRGCYLNGCTEIVDSNIKQVDSRITYECTYRFPQLISKPDRFDKQRMSRIDLNFDADTEVKFIDWHLDTYDIRPISHL